MQDNLNEKNVLGKYFSNTSHCHLWLERTKEWLPSPSLQYLRHDYWKALSNVQKTTNHNSLFFVKPLYVGHAAASYTGKLQILQQRWGTLLFWLDVIKLVTKYCCQHNGMKCKSRICYLCVEIIQSNLLWPLWRYSSGAGANQLLICSTSWTDFHFGFSCKCRDFRQLLHHLHHRYLLSPTMLPSHPQSIPTGYQVADVNVRGTEMVD